MKKDRPQQVVMFAFGISDMSKIHEVEAIDQLTAIQKLKNAFLPSERMEK